MKKWVSLTLAVVWLLTWATTALAFGPVYPHDSDPVWKAAYWNNMTLSGAPVLERDETNLDYDWGSGSPASGVNADGFSARWTRYIYVEAGTYRFTTTSDDGMRLWVDGTLLINEWTEHPAKTVSADMQLTTGHHWVVVEFYENQGLSVAKFSYTQIYANWRGEYFNNKTLSGSPALTREDASINFDWGAGSPASGTINADQFSVRWTRTLNFAAGNYRFSATVDDGVRLWVNNHLLIESWKDQPATTYSGEIYLPGGDIPLKMEYYENGGSAVAKLSWELASTPTIQYWKGEYFNNTSLSGTPALTRDDSQINFNWAANSPAAGAVNVDNFSVRWTRSLSLSAGRYRFTMTVDDGARLWVNNHLLIDVWYDQAARTYVGEIDLPSGNIPVKLEYYERGGLAVAQLSWSTVDATTPGTVVVNDTDAGFVKGGSSSGWRTASEGYGGRLTWTWNNDYERPNYNWARWYPALAAGRYEVYVFIPERYTTTAYARYWVIHADGTTQQVVNQSTNGGRWVSLGIYRFDGGGDEYVLLTDATGESRLTRLVAFDAVKWAPR